ncbi:MAG: HEPN domain-containing protein [Candidatus Micrarchaeota archaeon]
MQIRTRPVDRAKSAVYFRKAKEFFNGMQKAQAEAMLNLACLNAIHCTISCADALGAHFLGERSAGQSHDDAAVLVLQTKLPGISQKARQIRDILNFKTLVEYSDDEPTEAEAARLILQTARVFEWAKQLLSEKG